MRRPNGPVIALTLGAIVGSYAGTQAYNSRISNYQPFRTPTAATQPADAQDTQHRIDDIVEGMPQSNAQAKKYYDIPYSLLQRFGNFWLDNVVGTRPADLKK